jgi:hypothetical protein
MLLKDSAVNDLMMKNRDDELLNLSMTSCRGKMVIIESGVNNR